MVHVLQAIHQAVAHLMAVAGVDLSIQVCPYHNTLHSILVGVA